uniref:Phospholipid-transporting ATPase n=1 Tax=Plectus sambesii TaxID=2011161 RepID=A0A914W4H3_9BILA
MLRSVVRTVEQLLVHFRWPGPPPALAVCQIASTNAPTSAPYDINRILQDFGIVFGVPKSRTSRPTKQTRKYSYNKLLPTKTNLISCQQCGGLHEIHTICGRIIDYGVPDYVTNYGQLLSAMYPKLAPLGDARSHQVPSHQVPLQMECESPEECNNWLVLFRRYDRDRDGFIPVNELRQWVHESGASFGLSGREQEALLTNVDHNGDHLVDFAEFCTLMSKAKRHHMQHIMFRAAQFILPKSQREQPFSELQQYNCMPPPLFLIFITLAQIGVYIYYVVDYDYGISISGPVPTRSPLIYDPTKRYQVWRYLSYMFIHIGIYHILFNSLTQIIIGIPLELVHKPWRIAIVYLLGVVAGSLAVSVSDPNVFLAGASGGVYALITAHVANLIVNWAEMEFAIIRALAMAILIGADVGVAIYNRYALQEGNKVSYVAHIGGGVAGLLLGIVVLRNFRKKLWERVIWWIALVGFVILFLFTCKYNAVTFLPRFLMEQFRRYNNIFFLIIALLQQIPDVSPTGRYTTAVPFIIILSISALKEIFEDLKRRKSDMKVNNFRVQVFRGTTWMDYSWKDVCVGDVVRVDNDHLFPADLVLLSSSEPQAMAYIETSNLDGETNLKIRQGLTATSHLLDHEKLANFNAEIECDTPNRHVHEFTGTLKLPDHGQAYPLGSNQMLLRGARLKNTKWVFGAVVYTGHDSKLLMNSKTAPLKRSDVDIVTNKQIIYLFFALIIMALVSAVGAQIWENGNIPEAWYLGFDGSNSANFGWNLLTFFILYNNLIPISLQVTLEVVRFLQAFYINNVRLSCTDEAEVFDDRSLLANLNGRHITAPFIREFLTIMSVCHTVVPEQTPGDDTVNYQASSPDESALVRGASTQDFVFHTRKPESITVRILGEDKKFELLNVLEFTSDRKRMGVVVRCPDGKIKLYVKGADNVIYERLSKSEKNLYLDSTTKDLIDFASKGYRTLCFAKADISEERYTEWRQGFYEASIAIERREQRLAEEAEKIECDLTLIGATAIEDKLQDDVPETIAALLKAEIKIWVLTGDKRETAINIAHSCRLLSPQTTLLIIDKATYEETFDKIHEYLERMRVPNDCENDVGLIIEGASLRHALIGEARGDFRALATVCRAVVCCRATPMQKAEVVELIKEATNEIVLAVGDGANDVAMIQAANVGIGISGQEGLQAASASDYAIGQFRFLRRLLLVHGASNFHRTVKVILYSFYKNICLYIIELWFAFFSAWSGQAMFERWTIGLFNVIFTAWPPLALGLFDRPATDVTMLKYPKLYVLSQKRDAFSVKEFWIWIGMAVWHSILLFFLTFGFLHPSVVWDNGRTGGWLMLGNSVYTYVVATVCIKALLESDTWSVVMHIATWGSILLWIVFLLIYSEAWVFTSLGADMLGMSTIVFSSPLFWAGLLVIPVSTLLLDFTYKVVKRTIFRSVADDVRLMEHSMTSSGGGFVAAFTSRRRTQPPTPGNLTLSQYGSTAPVQRSESAITSSTMFSATPTSPMSPFVDMPGMPDVRFASTRGDNVESIIDRSSSVEAERMSETARLLKGTMFRRSSSGAALQEQAMHGFAFSQEEHGAVAQSDLIRSYDSTRAKPQGL